MEKYLVTGLKVYSFTDERTGKVVQGTNCFYLNDEVETEGNFRGMQTLKVKGNFDLKDSFPVLPGFYNLSFRTKPDAKGQPVLSLFSASFVSGVSFVDAKKGA